MSGAASYLGFLSNVQNELELLRDGQIFLWRLLGETRREVRGSPVRPPDTEAGRGPYHGFRDLRHDAPLDPPTSATQEEEEEEEENEVRFNRGLAGSAVQRRRLM